MDGDCRSGGKSDEKKSAEKSTQTMQDFGQEVPFSLVELPSIDNTVLFPKPCYPWNIVNTPIIENSDGGVCLDSTQLASAILKGELDSNTAKIFMNARQFIPDSM